MGINTTEELLKRQERITAGGFWLSPPCAKYGCWGIKWHDAAAGQTRRVTARPSHDARGRITGTEEADVIEARAALARWADANPQVIKREAGPDRAATLLALAKPLTAEALEELGAQAQASKALQSTKKMVPQQDLAVTACMLHYNAVKGPTIKSHTVREAMRNVLEIWGNPMVSELNDQMQDLFIAKLRAKGIADWTILTRMNCIWATMRYIARKQYLVASVIPERLATNLWDPPAQLPNRNARLSEDDLARLFDAAAEMDSEHAWRYMILAVASAARPLAPCEAQVNNVDFEAGTLSLLEIEKRGVQSHKRKATIRCCPTLLMWLRHWATEQKPAHHDPQFITFLGNRLRTMAFFKALCKRAGVTVPNRAGSYVLRHTMATWMARCAVPEEERKFMMGQKVATGSHGFYMHFDPSYLLKASTAIEQLFQLIAARMKSRKRNLLSTGVPQAPLPVVIAELCEQPLPEEMTGHSLRLLLAGNSISASVGTLRGNKFQISEAKQDVR